MFQERPRFVRVAAVAALSACCLAAAACSSTTSSTGTAASPSSTPDPLAGLTAAKIQAEAIANAEAAPSLTLAGTVSQSGQSYNVDLGIKRGQGCTGTVEEGSSGSFKLIVIGKTIYLNPDNRFWTTAGGSGASAIIALVNGRYIKTTTSDKNTAGLTDVCNISKMLAPDKASGTVTDTKGTVTTLNGIRVLQLKSSDGSAGYVTDTSKPELVEAIAPKGAKNGSGKITVSVGAPVTLTAPPASQVINGSAVGL